MGEGGWNSPAHGRRRGSDTVNCAFQQWRNKYSACAATLIASPEGRIVVNATGGPVLGTGGTGDVLTGVVAGLLAQGLAPLVAAALGVYLHGFAGDRLAVRLGPSGVLAGEVARELPRAARVLGRHGMGQGGIVSQHLRDGRALGHERGLSISFP